MIGNILGTGRRRSFDGRPRLTLYALSAIFALGVVYANIFALPDALLIGILFICGIYTLLFLTVGATMTSPDKPTIFDIVLSVSSIACGVFFYSIRGDLANHITLLYQLSADKLIFGSILLLLTIEATRRTTGPGLTVVVLIFLAYNLFGHHLPPPLGHGYIDFGSFIDTLMYTTDGVFGVPVQVAGSYVFLFVMFGCLLTHAGGAEFMFKLSAALTGRSPGGPAKIAVVSSGMYGTISGSPTSDVATTGSVTIPIMKRLGYPPRFAGAVEIAASTGGSALPPVMGSAAFILAEYTGISYRNVILAALIPAVLFYLSIFLQVHFRAVRLGMAGMDTEDSALDALRTGWVFVVPVIIIIVALLAGYTPTYVAMFATLSLVGASYLTRATRMTPRRMLEGLGETTLRMLPVAGACAAAGLVIGGLTMTGLALKASSIVLLFAGSSEFLLLVLGAIIAIIVGLGMPTPAAYILSAVLIGPAFAAAGFSLLSSNMFLLFYAILSALTPPVAVAAFAAAAIAEEDAMKIAVTAVKLAAVGFILPFFFVWNEALLANGTWLEVGVAAIGGLAAVTLLALVIESDMSWPMRAVCLAAATAMLSPYLAVAIPMLMIVLAIGIWWKRTGGLPFGIGRSARRLDVGNTSS
ncbi:TRAP transporter fused permease subunit [Chelativorans sp. ZYF759]|uniref:TRAP transporter permease n=1 Tax=Chelativorans sp. ZYF759 TaxID=2692213 RepID=UPI00145F9B84|nr:TRAP transporter fused permease subunit [Chelativorans sp. ZYF759]NMG41925.1 TRAP transporter fused permease subunit [Chelativorans sp. ZYF759]